MPDRTPVGRGVRISRVLRDPALELVRREARHVEPGERHRVPDVGVPPLQQVPLQEWMTLPLPKEIFGGLQRIVVATIYGDFMDLAA